MKIFIGYVLMIGTGLFAFGMFYICLFAFMTISHNNDFFIALGVFLVSSCCLLYFNIMVGKDINKGKKIEEDTVEDNKRITYENELMKLKIEQRKLQNELKELQANK